MGEPDAGAGGGGRAGRVSATATSRAGPLALPGRLAHAASDYRPLQAPSRNRPLPGRDSLTPQLVGPGRFRDLQPPAGPPMAPTAARVGLPVPPGW